MNELGTAPAILLDVLLIIVTMSALTWRESRWSRRASTVPQESDSRRDGRQRTSSRVREGLVH